MPKAKTDAIEQYKAQNAAAATHRFDSQEAKITLGIEMLTWGLDMGFTCNTTWLMEAARWDCWFILARKWSA